MQARALLGATLVAALIAYTLALVTYVSVRSFLITQRDTTIEREAFANVRAIADELRLNPASADRLISTLRSEQGSVVLVRVGDSWSSSAIGTGPEALPPSLLEALDDDSAAIQRFRANGRPLAAVGVPIGEPALVYVEVFPQSALESTLSALRRNLLIGATIVALSGAVLARWTTRRAMRPLRATSRAAEQLARGELTTRLNPDLDPDLDRMITAFNAMADSLTQRIEREARVASDVSHELRTPVATIRAATDVLLRRRDELGERGQEALDLLSEEVDEFDQLVADLLEISRLDAGVEPEHIESVLLPDAMRRLARQHGVADLPIEIADTSLDEPVSVDRRRLERVVSNLLRNAQVHAGGPVGLLLDRAGDRLLIAVDDAGPGIAVEDRQRIFERFARGGEARGQPGSGLGLAIAVEHARGLGGALTVTERPGGGARFVLSFTAAGS